MAFFNYFYNLSKMIGPRISTKLRPLIITSQLRKAYSESICHKGLVLGLYRGCQPSEVHLTEQAQIFDTSIQNRVSEFLRQSNIVQQKVVVAHGLHKDYLAVAFVDIGQSKNTEYNDRENMDQCLESTRVGTAIGVQALQSYLVDEIHVEAMSNAGAAAEGSVLGAWFLEGYKSIDYMSPKIPKICPFNISEHNSWLEGKILGEAQNLSRELAHMPPNIGTPETLSAHILDLMCSCKVVTNVRHVEWIRDKGLNVLLNVAKGSRRPPILLDLIYCGGSESDKPVVLVGDGCTYDSWGLCLRNNKSTKYGMFRKCGATSVIGIMKAAAQLSLPLKINALVPLYENKPGGMALKPGSIIKTSNGETAEVHQTNVSSRMVLSDLIAYSQILNPQCIVNVASLSEDTQKYFDSGACVVFTSDENLYEDIRVASVKTGDRVIRAPLWDFYGTKTKWPTLGDVRVLPHQNSGDAMAAAMFLENYKPQCSRMVTLDIAGSAFLRSSIPQHYLRPSLMTGSPVRTVIQLLKQIACPNDNKQLARNHG
ncbi:cytosol aminopeptidase-like [Daktulosphaira vitifoliae]|uniref:cytosol aminopeptidase-like n=1 Tax=Daktulosphaira vitifoliae TaxID=58002 RepID=UPI0021A9C16F|nr:cytosol aminopeptidase-like [Daktulosphaira vitifoliae]